MKRMFVAFVFGLVGVGALPNTAVADDDWKIISDQSMGSVRTINMMKSEIDLPLSYYGPVIFVNASKKASGQDVGFNDALGKTLAGKGFTIPASYPGSKVAKANGLGATTVRSQIMFLGDWESFKPIATDLAEKNGRVINWAGVGETIISGAALAAGALLSNQYLGVAGMSAASMQSQFAAFSKEDGKWFATLPLPDDGAAPAKVAIIKTVVGRVDFDSFFMQVWADPVFTTVYTYQPGISDDKLEKLAVKEVADVLYSLAQQPLPQLTESQRTWLSK